MIVVDDDHNDGHDNTVVVAAALVLLPSVTGAAIDVVDVFVADSAASGVVVSTLPIFLKKCFYPSAAPRSTRRRNAS